MPENGQLPSLAGLHVLVVDDDEDSLLIMESTLRHFGALVTAVDSVKAAFRMLADWRPDVIVTDLAMPEDDGLAFMRELNTQPQLAAIPALAVTAYDHLYSQHQLRVARFGGLLRKPIRPPDLARAVAALARVAPPRRDKPA